MQVLTRQEVWNEIRQEMKAAAEFPDRVCFQGDLTFDEVLRLHRKPPAGNPGRQAYGENQISCIGMD